MTAPIQDQQTDYDSFDSAKILYDKYAAHGQLNGLRTIVIWTGPDKLTGSPAVSNHGNGVCSLVGISDYYSELARSIGKPEVLNSHGMKAFIVAHEDMHCRIRAENFALDGNGEFANDRDRLLHRFDSLVNESAADSMAILVVARRDGVPAAIAVLDQVRQIRVDDGFGTGHDSRQTLDLLRDTLMNHPERFLSDEGAFRTALTTGLQGAVQTYAGQLTPQEKEVLSGKEFLVMMQSQVNRLTGALDTYNNGNFPAAVDTVRSMSGTHKRYELDLQRQEGRAVPDAEDLRTFREQVKGIMSELEAKAGLQVGATDNGYLRGRSQEMSAGTAAPSHHLENRPTAMRR